MITKIKETTILVDATEKFAHRTADFLLKSDLSRGEKAARLKLFSDDHVKRIGDAAKKIKAGQA